MPLYSKKDFADLCYTTTSDLSNYIRRKNVVVTDDNPELIDSSNATNAAFMVKRQTLQTKKTITGKGILDKKPSIAEGKGKVVQTAFEYPPEMKVTVMENFQTEATLKKSTLEKTSNEIKLQQLKIQKLQGDVIPTQLVKNLIAQHSKSITVAFRNGAENFLIDIAKKAGLNGEQSADLRGKLIKIINASVDESIKETAAGLKHIVSEYTKQRGVGESE